MFFIDWRMQIKDKIFFGKGIKSRLHENLVTTILKISILEMEEEDKIKRI